MISYDPGDVILVDIAFSGVPGYKRRPAVVISKDIFNTAGIKLIVAAITSTEKACSRFGRKFRPRAR